MPVLTRSTRRSLLWFGLTLAVGAVGGLAATVKIGPFAVAGLVGVVVLLRWPQLALLGAAVSLPFVASVSLGGQRMAVGDLLLVLGLAGCLLRRQTYRLIPRSRVVIAVLAGVAGYGVVAFVEAGILHQTFSMVTAVYRMLLMLMLPLLAGLAFGRHTPLIKRFLTTYVVVACGIAAVWTMHFSAASMFGINKNPGGQMMVNAAVVLLVHRKIRPIDAAALLILIVGILATGSRGSLIAVGVGFLVILLARFSEALTWKRCAMLIAAGIGVLAMAPASTTDRLFAENQSGQYNAEIRNVFVRDVLHQSEGHLLLGHGVGTYQPVDSALARVPSLDPHNVFALQIFEGGIPLLAAFVLAMVIPVYLLWGRRQDLVALAAIAALLSVLVHSYVDIFWVRATPTFAWFLLGVGLARTLRPTRAEPAPVLAIPTQRGPSDLRAARAARQLQGAQA